MMIIEATDEVAEWVMWGVLVAIAAAMLVEIRPVVRLVEEKFCLDDDQDNTNAITPKKKGISGLLEIFVLSLLFLPDWAWRFLQFFQRGKKKDEP